MISPSNRRLLENAYVLESTRSWWWKESVSAVICPSAIKLPTSWNFKCFVHVVEVSQPLFPQKVFIFGFWYLPVTWYSAWFEEASKELSSGLQEQQWSETFSTRKKWVCIVWLIQLLLTFRCLKHFSSLDVVGLSLAANLSRLALVQAGFRSQASAPWLLKLTEWKLVGLC